MWAVLGLLRNKSLHRSQSQSWEDTTTMLGSDCVRPWLVKTAYVDTRPPTWNFFERNVGWWKDRKRTFVHHGVIGLPIDSVIIISTFFKWIGPRRDLYFSRFIYLLRSYIRVCFQLVAFVREHIWDNVLWIGYSMKLELTRLKFESFSFVYGFIWRSLISFFFLRVCLPKSVHH